MVNKFLVLICTGMPGMQRLIMFAFLERLLSINSLGSFASDYSILQAISFFSAVGWCGIVLARVPKLDELESKEYLSNVLLTAVTYFLFFIIFLYFLHKFGLLQEYYGGVLFLFSWMLYQILRHNHISYRSYDKIIISDVLSVVVFVVLVMNGFEALLSTAISYLFSICVLVFRRVGFNLNNSLVCVPDQVKAIQISLSNFLSTSIILMLPFLVEIEGKEYSALIGYVLSVAAIAQLLPRGISLYYTPKLAISGVQAMSVFKFYFALNVFVVFLIFSFLCGAYLFLDEYAAIAVMNVEGSKNIAFYILIAISVGSLTVPASTYMLALERSDYLFKSSIVGFVFSLIGVLVFYSRVVDVEVLAIMIIFSAIIKLFVTYTYLLSALRLDLHATS